MKALFVGCFPLEGQTIEYLLQTNRPDIEYLGQVFSEDEGLEMIKTREPEVVFLDTSILELDALGCLTKAIIENNYNTNVVVISASDDFYSARQAMRFGARDYLLKPVRAEELIDTVDRITPEVGSNSKNKKKKEECFEVIVECRTRLLELIYDGKVDSVYEAYTQYWQEIVSEYGEDKDCLTPEFFSLVYAIRKHCQLYKEEHYLNNLYSIISEKCVQILLNLSETENAGDLFQALFDFCLDCTKMYSNKQSENGYNQVQQAKKIINENIDKAITLESVARNIYISSYYLSRLFKACTGMNFSDYLIERRIESAKKLLLTTNRTIESISVAVGYNEPNSFRRLFKKKEGISPSDFRKKCCKSSNIQ